MKPALAVFLTLTSLSAFGQSSEWMQIAIPATSIVRSVVVHNEMLFVTTADSGVARSTDNGLSWVSAKSGLTASIGMLQTSTSGNLFAGSSKGVYRTTNNGDFWSLQNNGIPTGSSREIHALKAAPDNHLFIGSFGVYRSTNGGANWADNSNFTQVDHKGIVSFALDSTGNLYMGSDGAVYRTTDLGGKWEKKFNCSISTNVLTIATSNSGIVYFGTDDSGMYRSTNLGDVWTRIDNLPLHRVAELLVDDETVYAWNGDSGIFRSTTGGASWEPFSNGLVSLRSGILYMSPTRELYAGNYGLYRLQKPALVEKAYEQKAIRILENPCHSVLRLADQFTSHNILIRTLVGIPVQYISGQMITSEATIDISALPSGTYILEALGRHDLKPTLFIKL